LSFSSISAFASLCRLSRSGPSATARAEFDESHPIGVVNLGHGPAKFVRFPNNAAAAAARIPDGHVRKLLAPACAGICHASDIVRSGCSWERGWKIRLLSSRSRPFPPQVERASERALESGRERERESPYVHRCQLYAPTPPGDLQTQTYKHASTDCARINKSGSGLPRMSLLGPREWIWVIFRS